MNYKSLSRDFWLLQNFRNGWEMVRYLRNPHQMVEATLWNGQKINHPQCNGLIEALIEIWQENVYLPENIRSQINDGDVIIDIGANIGLFSIKCAELKPKAKIIALEPFPDNFRFLQQNLSSFNISNVVTLEMALSASGGERKIISVGDRSLDHRLKNSRQEDSAISAHEGLVDSLTEFQINSISLEQLFSQFNLSEIAFMKMDIEGAENEVFADIKQDTLLKIKYLAIEYHDNIVPDTLKLITDKMSETHTVDVNPSPMGCGMLYASRK